MANNIDRPNKATNEQIKSFVERVRNLDADILSLKGRYAKEVKDIKDDINDILEEAKNKGIPKKSLKAALEEIRLLEKLDSVRDGLDDDQLSSLDDVREATVDIREAIGWLADLPLGAAAIQADDKKKAGKRKSEADKSIIGAALDGGGQTDIEDEAQRAAAEDAEKRKIAEQRESDDSAFSDLDSLKKNQEAKQAKEVKVASNVTNLDPKSARERRRAQQKEKTSSVKEAADRAEAALGQKTPARQEF